MGEKSLTDAVELICEVTQKINEDEGMIDSWKKLNDAVQILESVKDDLLERIC